MATTQSKQECHATTVAHIKRTTVLAELAHNDEAMDYFAGFLEYRRFAQGEYLVLEGANNDSAYFLIEGQVEVMKTTPDGDSFRVLTLDSSDHAYMGEGALLHDEPRGSSIKALSACVCLVLSRARFQEFCDARPDWGFPIVKHIAGDLSVRLRKTTNDFLMTYQALIREIRGSAK